MMKNKGSMAPGGKGAGNSSYKSEKKYSSQTNSARDKHCAEKKYSVKNSMADSNAKYSSQEKYTVSTKTSSSDKYSSNKGAEKVKAEDKKYPSLDKNNSGQDKYGSGIKGGQDSKRSEKQEDKYGGIKSSESKFSASAKYSATKSDDKGSNKVFGGKTFSSQTSSSTSWDADRDRAFPYDRDHELRKSQNRYDADYKHMDPKYRKSAALTTGAILGAGAAVGAATTAGAGLRDGKAQKSDAFVPHSGEPTRATAKHRSDPSGKGCNNCEVQ